MNASAKLSEISQTWPESNEGLVVPYDVFTDKRYYDIEQEIIFRGDAWSFVGLDAELPNNGDYKTTYMGESPVLITRDNTGHINVMQNRCAHRGALICRERRGNAKRLQCVYHQWAYDLKGQLRGVSAWVGSYYKYDCNTCNGRCIGYSIIRSKRFYSRRFRILTSRGCIRTKTSLKGQRYNAQR